MPALRQHYGRRHVIVVCQDDPSELEAIAPQIGDLHAALVVEREPGPLSALLGRPSVTACDSFLDIAYHGERLAPARALDMVRGFEWRCEECPQAADELGSPWARYAMERARS
ncbi:MAG TPA: hypothetical protein VEI97_11105 [bacterium]|nr:hypothetical protein [bacterium]